jgi:hypothetical protein
MRICLASRYDDCFKARTAQLMLNALRDLFGCAHRRTTFPLTTPYRKLGSSIARPADTATYVACLDCGKEFRYDWQGNAPGQTHSRPLRKSLPLNIPGQQETPRHSEVLHKNQTHSSAKKTSPRCPKLQPIPGNIRAISLTQNPRPKDPNFAHHPSPSCPEFCLPRLPAYPALAPATGPPCGAA